MKTAWIRLIERRTLRESAALHATAELERTEIESLGLGTAPIQCVPNGVGWPEPHADFADGPLAGTTGQYALFLSRIDGKKGLDRLLNAWNVEDLEGHDRPNMARLMCIRQLRVRPVTTS